MNIKKSSIIAFTTALLTVPAFGLSNAKAANIEETQNRGTGVNKYIHTKTTTWSVLPAKGSTKEHPINVTKTFKQGGHTYIVQSNGNTPGTIIGMDGSTSVSNAQVMAALKGEDTETNTSTTSTTTPASSTNTASDTDTSTSNELPQTGESKDGSVSLMAGITAIAAAMLTLMSGIFKRNRN